MTSWYRIRKPCATYRAQLVTVTCKSLWVNPHGSEQALGRVPGKATRATRSGVMWGDENATGRPACGNVSQVGASA